MAHGTHGGGQGTRQLVVRHTPVWILGRTTWCALVCARVFVFVRGGASLCALGMPCSHNWLSPLYMQTRLQLINQSALHSDVQPAVHVAQRSDALTVANDRGGYGHFNNRECVLKMKDVHM